MSWMIQSHRLDKDQENFINNKINQDGNVWVKGFAGSGKSVLLIHALKKVIKNNPNSKVLIVVYTHALIDLFKTGLKELEMSASIPVITYYNFVDNYTDKYDYIFCDEVQDLPSKVLHAMITRAIKVIVAGDSNQSIYQQDPKWGEAVVPPQSVGAIISAESFELNTIHRLTKSIISALSKLIPGIEIWKAKKDETKLDVQIRVYEAENPTEEAEYVFNEAIKGPANRNETSAILLPTHHEIVEFINSIIISQKKEPWTFLPIKWDKDKPLDKQKPDYKHLNAYLKKIGSKLQYVGNDFGSLKDCEISKSVIVMTYNSSKGLDFDNVFIPKCNGSLGGKKHISSTLFMVAMSRSKLNLFITYFGYPHSYIKNFIGITNEFGIPITENKKIVDLNTTNNNNINDTTFDY